MIIIIILNEQHACAAYRTCRLIRQSTHHARMSQFNPFFLPYQVHEESECDICGIFILESNNIASYNNNYRPRTDPPQTFKNVYASGFSLSRYHYSERTQSPPASQPATFLFRVTFGAKRKLIHHTVTVTDGTFLFLFLFCFSHLASSAWGIMRLRILVEKEKVVESLSLLSPPRDRQMCKAGSRKERELICVHHVRDCAARVRAQVQCWNICLDYAAYTTIGVLASRW